MRRKKLRLSSKIAQKTQFFETCFFAKIERFRTFEIFFCNVSFKFCVTPPPPGISHVQSPGSPLGTSRGGYPGDCTCALPGGGMGDAKIEFHITKKNFKCSKSFNFCKKTCFKKLGFLGNFGESLSFLLSYSTGWKIETPCNFYYSNIIGSAPEAGPGPRPRPH